MTEGRKIAAILVADIVGYSRLAGADEERTLARLRALRSDLIDPTIAVHNGRLVKRTGDGAVVEFRSVVEAVRCAIEVQSGLAERNAGVPPDKRIEARVGVHLGDVVEEANGDLMGDGVNVAARLEGICEAGGICLSAAAYEQVRDKLHEAFINLGEKSLKNIARPVRAYALKVGAAAAPVTVAAQPRVGVQRWTAIAVALVAVLLAAGWLGWQRFAPRPAPAPAPVSAAADEKLVHAPRLSIVVLPFANLSGDPEQDYFADALTDDLTSDLTHIPDSFVIGRSTAAAYTSKPVDLKILGRDLGVRYAVEGSMRREGDMVTLNAQLISIETGAHVWADRFEGERGKLGALQVEFVSRIANALGVQLVQAESLRAIRERPVNPDAADLVMRGLAAFDAGFTPENFNNAIGYFDQALRLDPDNWRALTGKAEAQMVGLMSLGLGKEHGREVLDDAEAAVDRVLAAQPNYAHAHLTKGLIAKVRGQSDVWLAESNAAIASDRNFAAAYAEKSHYMITHGRSPEAFELAEQALRLDPHDVGRNIWEWYVCNAHAHLAQWEQAIEWCQKSAASNPALFWPHYELAAAYAWLGQSSDAAREVSELRKLWPDATVHLYRELQDFPDPTFVTERDRIMEGLRKAGLPKN
jgi:adenylate cyclase